MQVFSLAVECALDRDRPVPTEEALDLWALAASLQVRLANPWGPAFDHQSFVPHSGLCMHDMARNRPGTSMVLGALLCLSVVWHLQK